DKGLERFTTVMSISPHKRIEMLNAAGKSAAEEYGVHYEPYNFKKDDGFIKSIQLSRELGLYRQNYCGCRLSRAERDARPKNNTEGV
ncbi:MAG: recombinase, partial [Chitinivibrionales bacterium]|nr:recombinase [Chitinivibrionales bacterium]MBD3356695.1 recombinase [Chitinivibrionales bacterium]